MAKTKKNVARVAGLIAKRANALASPVRAVLAALLADTPMSVGALSRAAGTSLSGASQQLKVLKSLGVVTCGRDPDNRQSVVYSVVPGWVRGLIDALEAIAGMPVEAKAKKKGGKARTPILLGAAEVVSVEGRSVAVVPELESRQPPTKAEAMEADLSEGSEPEDLPDPTYYGDGSGVYEA